MRVSRREPPLARSTKVAVLGSPSSPKRLLLCKLARYHSGTIPSKATRAALVGQSEFS